ncbi:Regulator of RpoS [Candidatus Lokiarchaeum ossiferum]|uniref:Regulator of RpoS n=1 Tax=Candidatus Lokiarchaeum ossiferum TaxID=2951803 RepID=A0ABY6HTC2_9ARCH|nr:Regulator of RpoS [Candidatus Lokiarchaeum sp. B-35]
MCEKKNTISSQRVLVMDDDHNIQNILSKVLRRMDCEVDCADAGEEALEKYRKSFKSSKPYDLVILDLIVPNGMGGLQTMVGLKEINPDVKAIISSGYFQEQDLTSYKEYGFSSLLNKPYTIDELISSISECLANNADYLAK